jgi:hypothetical protein
MVILDCIALSLSDRLTIEVLLVTLENLSKRTKSDDVVDNFCLSCTFLAHSEFRVRDEDRLEIRVLLFMNADPSPYPNQDKTARHESHIPSSFFCLRSQRIFWKNSPNEGRRTKTGYSFMSRYFFLGQGKN